MKSNKPYLIYQCFATANIFGKVKTIKLYKGVER